MRGNEIPTPEQNITSVRWYASHCRVLRHPTKGNMAHGETSVPAATDPGSSSSTCRLLRSHMTSIIRSEWTQATHRVLRCTHDSREAPLSAAPVVPVTSLASPLCLYLEMEVSHWRCGLCNKSNYSILSIKQISQSTFRLTSSFLVTAFQAKRL